MGDTLSEGFSHFVTTMTAPVEFWGHGPTTGVFSNDGKTMYVVDYGEVHADFEMPSPFYIVGESSVVWRITCTAR